MRLNPNRIAGSWTDPILFNEVWLARYPYWEKQRQIANALKNRKETILVPSGNGTGKSWLLAGLILWVVANGGTVVSTASINDQLEGILWRAIFTAFDKAPVKLFRERKKQSPLFIENLERGNYAIGLSTKSQEGTSGHHAEWLVVVVDESSGVESDRFSALDSLNPSTSILVGNPLVPEGVFFDRVTRQEVDPDPKTELVRIPSTESPEVKAGVYRSATGLCDLQFLERSKRNYGEGSPWWASHIEARFPTDAEGYVFPVDHVGLAIMTPKPDRTRLDPGPLLCGVDIAGGGAGDDSIILIRDDLGVLYLKESKTTPPELWAQEVAAVCRAMGIPSHRCVYDATGIGETFGSLLAALGFVGAVGFKGGYGTSPKFENLRAASYWECGRRFNPNLNPIPFHIPQEYAIRFRRELQAIKYVLTGKDKIKIIEKKDITARIGHSPDYSDALMMTYGYLA